MKKLIFLGIFTALFSVVQAGLVSAQTTTQGLSFRVTAFNETQNRNAEEVEAQREDFLLFKFMVTNSGTLPQNYAPEVDLSGFLPLVDVVDAGSGKITSEKLQYPVVNLQPGQSREVQLRVRVKYVLPPFSYVGSVSYGNVLRFEIASLLVGTGRVKYIAPTVGSSQNLILATLTGLLALTGFTFLKRKTFTA